MHISNNESDQKKIVKVFRVNKVLREKLVKIFKKGGKIGKKEKKKGRERQAKKEKIKQLRNKDRVVQNSVQVSSKKNIKAA